MEEYKGTLLPHLIKNFNLTKNQSKKLICVTSVCDGYGRIKSDNGQWMLRTSPNLELHSFTYDLFLYAYNIRFSMFSAPCKNEKYVSTEMYGKSTKNVLRDLFLFTPNFKTCPAKILHEKPSAYFLQPQPTIKFLFNEPSWLQKIAFRLALDLEGSITTKFSVKKKTMKKYVYYQFQFEPVLELSVTHPSLIFEWQKLAYILGIPLNVKLDKRSWTGLGGLRTSKQEKLINFYKEIGGFLFQTLIHKSSSNNGNINNDNYSKNCLLATCYELITKFGHLCSKSFSTREEAMKFRSYFIKNYYIPLRDKNKKCGPGEI